MSSKHTPGPWRVGRGKFRRFDIHQDSGPTVGGRYIGTTKANRIGEMPESVFMEDEANARLIADAPALLDALRELHDFSVVDVHWRNKEQSKKAFQTAIDLLTKHGA